MSMYGEFVKKQRQDKEDVDESYDKLIEMVTYLEVLAKEDDKTAAMFRATHGPADPIYHRHLAKSQTWAASAYHIKLSLWRQRADLFDHPGGMAKYCGKVRRAWR
jgi:hypothetical protein